MMTRRIVPVALAALVSTACPGSQPRQSVGGAPGVGAEVTSSPQDTAFEGTTAPLQRLRATPAGVPAAMLRAVTAASARGYDRIVFELSTDNPPGYRVEYAAGPVRSCGSGDVVSVAGMQRLLVRFEPARAHDDRGNPVPQQRDVAPGLPAVKEVKLVCDFEGQVEWVIGVATAEPYRVTELTGPARLLLDVKHGP